MYKITVINFCICFPQQLMLDVLPHASMAPDTATFVCWTVSLLLCSKLTILIIAVACGADNHGTQGKNSTDFVDCWTFHLAPQIGQILDSERNNHEESIVICEICPDSPWLKFCLHPWVSVRLGTSLQGVGWSRWMLLLYGLEEST